MQNKQRTTKLRDGDTYLIVDKDTGEVLKQYEETLEVYQKKYWAKFWRNKRER